MPLKKVLEVSFRDSESNGAIFNKLRNSLVNAAPARGKTILGRHPDLRIFDQIGPHIDWRTLIGLG